MTTIKDIEKHKVGYGYYWLFLVVCLFVVVLIITTFITPQPPPGGAWTEICINGEWNVVIVKSYQGRFKTATNASGDCNPLPQEYPAFWWGNANWHELPIDWFNRWEYDHCNMTHIEIENKISIPDEWICQPKTNSTKYSCIQKTESITWCMYDCWDDKKERQCTGDIIDVWRKNGND